MAESKIILPGYHSQEQSELKAFANWLDTNKLSRLEDDEISELLESIGRFHEKLSRERQYSDLYVIRRYEAALLTIQRIAVRMTAFAGTTAQELRVEIDKVIKGAKINERK